MSFLLLGIVLFSEQILRFHIRSADNVIKQKQTYCKISRIMLQLIKAGNKSRLSPHGSRVARHSAEW